MDNKIKLDTPLSLDDINFRVQSINNGGYMTVLAYKNARVDMQRLDDVCGIFGWKREHHLINNKEFCTVSILNTITNEWISKQDCGTESKTEALKGETSDAFKRACFNWGIGRELYDYPVIQIKLTDEEYNKQTKKTSYGFSLNTWVWAGEFSDKGKLILLACKDSKNTVRFKWKHKDYDKLTTKTK